jgi:Icc-related predicted phosphoesterase
MKIFLISDTHAMHDQLIIPEGIDMIIHAGDSTNYKDLARNNNEFLSFIEWFDSLDIKHKILIGGNHDASLTKKYNTDFIKEKGIIYLEHEYIEIEGLLLFGSPYTPSYGGWHFMKSRNNMYKLWDDALVEGIDILITHGPPKGILDLTYDINNTLIQVGDSSLRKVVDKVKPKYHVFGHIHDCKDLKNSGIYKQYDTTFINASCVKDGEFNKGLFSNGYLIHIP